MLQIIQEKNLLTDLKIEWDNLSNKMNDPLLSYDWFYAAILTIHKNDELRVFIIREKQRIIAIAPLYIDAAGDYKQLSILGAAALYEPSNLIFENRRALEKLLHAIFFYGLPFVLLRMPAGGHVQSILNEFNVKHGIAISKVTASSNYINLGEYSKLNASDSIDCFTRKGMSSSRRYELRRKRKCLEKLGKVEFKFIKPTVDNYNEIFSQVLNIEDASWKGDENSSLLKNKILADFFYNFTQSQVKKNGLQVCLLCVDDVPVSMHLSVETSQSCRVLKIGQLPAYNKCSPGILTAMETICYCLKNGIANYEFLGSEENWQQRWPVESHEFCVCLFFPYRLGSIFSLIKLLLSQLKKRIFS